MIRFGPVTTSGSSNTTSLLSTTNGTNSNSSAAAAAAAAAAADENTTTTNTTTLTTTTSLSASSTSPSSWYLHSYYVPDIHEALLSSLVDQAKDYALNHGIIMTPKRVIAGSSNPNSSNSNNNNNNNNNNSSSNTGTNTGTVTPTTDGGHLNLNETVPTTIKASSSSSMNDSSVDHPSANGSSFSSSASASASSASSSNTLHALQTATGAIPISSIVTHAPFTLFPSPIPQEQLKKAQSLQSQFNLLVHKVSLDHEFLISTLSETAENDVFTARLLSILKMVTIEQNPQPIVFGIHRSDYMLHFPSSSEEVDVSPSNHVDKRIRLESSVNNTNTEQVSVSTATSEPSESTSAAATATAEYPTLKQVEINTIAASFGGLGSITTRMHDYILSRFEFKADSVTLPENAALARLAEGMATAWKLYNKPASVIMMIVQPGEHNSYDQRWLEHTLWERYHIKIIRQTLAEISTYAILDDTEKILWIDAKEVAVAYFRAGYSPLDYPTEDEWDARLTVERSKCIKCPNIGYHLAGTKKVQQALSTPEALSRFISDSEVTHQMASAFVGLYSLSESEGDVSKIVSQAIKHPENYVLKPQREGGGNNLYSDNLKHALLTMNAQQRAAYILMDRIRPPKVINYIVRHGQAYRGEIVSELGIYGVFIAEGEKIILNNAAGHLLRSKFATFDDGGVVAGVAALDSPFPV